MKTLIERGMRYCAGRNGQKTERRSLVRRLRAFWFGHEDGNSLVEFALTLPILMAVLMAIFEFGIAFNNQLQLTQAVGAGAQYLQTVRGTTSDPCQDTMTAIKNSSPTLNSANISLSLTINGNSALTGSSCPSGVSELSLAQGDPVTVKATYPCNITIFGINLGGLTTRKFTCDLTAQVTEYEY
jgi:Flp pilus assembly protein TadG